jgi:RNA polymerase sigma-70 factor (ECF subfamily)
LENEPDILRRARDLEEEALAAIFDHYYPPIYRYIYHHVGHIETAEDLAAKVFQRLLQQFHADSGPEHHLKAWLYRVAGNLIIDESRRQQHRDHQPLDPDALIDSLNIEELSENHLLTTQVHAALLRLTIRYRDVIILRYLAEMSADEIAELMEMTVGAVKALQHRALTALRRELTEHFPEGNQL